MKIKKGAWNYDSSIDLPSGYKFKNQKDPDSQAAVPGTNW